MCAATVSKSAHFLVRDVLFLKQYCAVAYEALGKKAEATKYRLFTEGIFMRISVDGEKPELR